MVIRNHICQMFGVKKTAAKAEMLLTFAGKESNRSVLITTTKE